MAAKRKRKTVQQLKHGYEGRFEPVVMAVENPDWTRAKDGVAGIPRVVEMPINRRHDVIVWLHSRGMIDDAQKMAGDRFLWLWERMESGARAMDYGKEPVDGGAAWPDLDVKAIEAAKILDRLRIEVGHPDYSLLQHAICRRDTIAKIALGRYGNAREIDQKYLGRRLRDALDVAAHHWGLTTGPAKHYK